MTSRSPGRRRTTGRRGDCLRRFLTVVRAEMKPEDHEGREGSEGREERPRLTGELQRLTRTIVDAGLQVHRSLGPGLLETVYERCLTYELGLRKVNVQRQVALPVVYGALRLDAGYRLDILAEGQIIIEVKSVEALTRLHQAQLLTYLKLSGCKVGFLMNFNVVLFRDGVKRLLL